MKQEGQLPFEACPPPQTQHRSVCTLHVIALHVIAFCIGILHSCRLAAETGRALVGNVLHCLL